MAKALKLNINGEYELLEPEAASERVYTLEDYDRLVAEMIRQKYTVDGEFAIQRQRDIKVQEFEEYNSYCEECKNQAKILCGVPNV